MMINEAKELVEDIQQLLRVEDSPREEELIDLAGRHEECVDAVASRLAEVELLLENGRHDEAVDLAERAPNLQDLVTILDFPELEQWNELLLQSTIPTVRELPLDVLSQLSEAYSPSAGFENLLNLYRKQSLARISVEKRLRTLRKLSAVDTSGDQWSADIRKFEQHVVKQLARDLKQASANSDLPRVAEIDQHLNESAWQIRVPEQLKSQAASLHRKLRRNKARNELREVAPALSDAFAAFDQPEGERLRSRFLSLADLAELQPTDPIYDLAGPALEWLEEEEGIRQQETEFQAAITELDAAIDGQASVTELERLYSRAIRDGRSLPDLLENRLADRVETLRAAESRKRALTITVIVSCCLVALASVVLFVRNQSYNADVAGHAMQLDRLVESVPETGDLDAVDEYVLTIEEENSEFLTEPSILGPRKALETYRKNELARRARLDQLVDSTSTAFSAAADWGQVERVTAALNEAEEIALNDQEIATITERKFAVQEVRNRLQQKEDERFQRDFRNLQEQVAQLPLESLTGYSAVAETSQELQNRSRLSTQQRDLVGQLISKLTSQRSLVQEKIAIATSLQKVTESCLSPSDYRKSLVRYTQEHPQTLRSADFLSVIQSDTRLWEAAHEWNELRHQLLRLSFRILDPPEARKLSTACDDLLGRSPFLKSFSNIDRRIKAMLCIALRAQPDGTTVAQNLLNYLSADLLANAWQITTTDDRTYVLAAPPKVGTREVSIRYFSSSNGTTVEEDELRHNQVVAANRRDERSWLSPHSVLIRDVRTSLQEDLDKDFEQTVSRLVSRITDHPEIDPILKLILVNKLLDVGSTHSLFISERSERFRQAAANAGVSPFTNWVRPDDREAEADRRKASELFTRHADSLKTELAAAIGDRDQLRMSEIGPKLKCVGWLCRSNDRWRVMLHDELNPQLLHRLVTLSTYDQQPTIESLGDVSAGAVGHHEPDHLPSTSREGQLVFELVAQSG